MTTRSPAPRTVAALRPTLARPVLLAVLLLAGCAQPGPLSTLSPEPVSAAALRGADSLHVARVAPGVSHVHAWDATGPWAIHVLEAELGACLATLTARKAGPPLAARATTSALTAGAVGGVNADFFLLPAGTPVGAHVEAGQVLIGPGSRPIVAVAADGPWSGTAAVSGVVTRGAESIAISQVNRWSDRTTGAPDATGAVLFTHWHGERTPADTAAVAARVRRIGGTPTAGRGVVESIAPATEGVALDSTRVVFAGRGVAALELRALSAGDTIGWRAEVVPWPARGATTEAVGGFPILLRGGEPAPEMNTGVQPAFGERRHPRTAVGWSADGARVFLVTVDGRQPGYSDGMTLAELAALLRRLGAAEAINLDGGGSTAMVVRGAVVNRPSDREGERPVANALRLDHSPCR